MVETFFIALRHLTEHRVQKILECGRRGVNRLATNWVMVPTPKDVPPTDTLAGMATVASCTTGKCKTPYRTTSQIPPIQSAFLTKLISPRSAQFKSSVLFPSLLYP